MAHSDRDEHQTDRRSGAPQKRGVCPRQLAAEGATQKHTLVSIRELRVVPLPSLRGDVEQVPEVDLARAARHEVPRLDLGVHAQHDLAADRRRQGRGRGGGAAAAAALRLLAAQEGRRIKLAASVK